MISSDQSIPTYDIVTVTNGTLVESIDIITTSCRSYHNQSTRIAAQDPVSSPVAHPQGDSTQDVSRQARRDTEGVSRGSFAGFLPGANNNSYGPYRLCFASWHVFFGAFITDLLKTRPLMLRELQKLISHNPLSSKQERITLIV